MKTASIHKVVNILLLFTLIVSCEGEQGPIGKAGANSLTKLVDESPGVNCENGGVRVDLGIDNNSNGILDDEEILMSNYICNGLDGKISLIDIISEPAGLNCENGGYKINSGLDIDNNGNLTENEISSSVYLCNGVDGNNTLTKITTEPGGSNCDNGGIKIETGIDENRDGILNEYEINSSAYVCNGNDGSLSLVNIYDIPINSECTNGGVIIESGIDTNNNGILDDIEILSTNSICNGIDGDFDEEIRLVLTGLTLGSASGSSSSEGKVISELVKFDKRRWKL